MRMPRVVVAGTSSGVGKTLVACAIMRALRARGLRVQPFKAGPDYIDPGHHRLAASRDSRNLDSWIMGRSRLPAIFAAAASGADVSVIEGVMGYYDGVSGTSGRASTHEVARALAAPVVLVADASGSARSVAAAALGFARFSRTSNIAGVVLNRLGSARHEEFCTRALAAAGLRVLGALRRGGDLEMPSRHLGLVPAAEAASRRRAREAMRRASDSVDAAAIERIARSAPPLRAPPLRAPPRRASRAPPRRATIGVALDDSFNFYYRANLDALRREGARLVFFSPVSDARAPDCDGLYLGGGFPEVMAAELARNSSMRASVRAHAESGRVIYAECGGLMYLTSQIERGARRYEMSGVLGGTTRMRGRAVLNYTRGRIARACAALPRARRVAGHEFHYSQITGLPSDTRFAYELDAGEGIAGARDGIVQGGVLASYGHFYFDASGHARSIVRACARAARR